MGKFNWEPQAEEAVEQSMKQSPVPKLLRGAVKKKIRKASEKAAVQAGRMVVKPEDVMQGMLALMPKNVRNQVEKAMKKGPDALQELQDNLKKK